MFRVGDIVSSGGPSLKRVVAIDGDIITLEYTHNTAEEFRHCTRAANLTLVGRVQNLILI